MFRALPMAAGAVAFACPATAQLDLTSAPERVLARAADADVSGDVSAEEWAAFVASFEVAPDGSLDRRAVIGRALAPSLDADSDGRLLGRDVQAHLARLDADGSGDLDGGEMQSVISTGGRRGALLEGVIAFGADANGDGTLHAGEWAAACGAPDEEVPIERLAAWIGGSEAGRSEDREAWEPATLVLSMYASLDVTKDGRIAADDLERVFATLDANADGAVAADEIARMESQRRGDFSVGEEAGDVPLMPWQRSLEDALALSQETGKPLLLCVNVDGEAASEALAAGRYRMPEFAALASGFLPLLASPDRHAARDHDDHGRRIPDPRFGRLVCSEHVDIEPQLYERYFRGQRVAPRHVGVAPDGGILFDLFLLQDLGVVDEALREHGNHEVALPDAAALDEAGLLASRDAAARELLEERFLAADEDARLRLARAALDPDRSAQHPELLRMALRDRAPAVRSAAVDALAAHPRGAPLALFPDALRLAHGSVERTRALSEALAAIAAGSGGATRVRARRLSRIAAATLVESSAVDLELWKLALAGAEPEAPAAPRNPDEVYEALERLGERADETPDDPAVHALFAEVALRGARAMIENGGGNPGFLLQDALSAARRAVEADPGRATTWATLAVSAYLLSDFETAGDAAARALPGLLELAGSRLAADTLRALAESRTSALYAALGQEEAWPPEHVADVLAAYEVLLVHPYVTEEIAKAALDVQTQLEVHAIQASFARRALERFPDSATLHDYYRWQVLRDEGAEALLVAYDDLEVGEAMLATIRWFAGLAAFVAAEHCVQDRDPDCALGCYGRSALEFAASVEDEPGFAPTAAHYVALGHAGRARVLLDAGRLEEAGAALRECVATTDAPEVFAAEDGLGNSPAETAGALLRALRREGMDGAAEGLAVLLEDRGLQVADDAR